MDISYPGARTKLFYSLHNKELKEDPQNFSRVQKQVASRRQGCK